MGLPRDIMTAPPQHDFNHLILAETAHRPWPMPASAWVMTQTWHDLLFAHWPVSVDALRAKVPASFPVDRFDNQAWLGIVPFYMTNVAPRFVPALPWMSSFPELNVRTYVTVDDKPGIWFFTLDAASQLAVEGAKRLYRLPYHRARMSAERHGLFVHYESARAGAAFSGRYRGEGDFFHAEEGTLEYFLAERYCLYTADGGRLYRAQIHHPPWPLQRGEAVIDLNTMPPVTLPDEEPHLLFSARQDVVIWSLEEVAT
jgi:uncharacterized protein YqjF (DUF2071 family)